MTKKEIIELFTQLCEARPSDGSLLSNTYSQELFEIKQSNVVKIRVAKIPMKIIHYNGTGITEFDISEKEFEELKNIFNK